MTPPIKPRGASKAWPLSSIHVAAGQAISEGKALVRCDSGVIVLSFHPLSRIAPNVDGDGFALDADDGDTEPMTVAVVASNPHASHCHATMPTPDRPTGGCICGAWRFR